jgi:hypothetical protein
MQSAIIGFENHHSILDFELINESSMTHHSKSYYYYTRCVFQGWEFPAQAGNFLPSSFVQPLELWQILLLPAAL